MNDTQAPAPATALPTEWYSCRAHWADVFWLANGQRLDYRPWDPKTEVDTVGKCAFCGGPVYWRTFIEGA